MIRRVGEHRLLCASIESDEVLCLLAIAGKIHTVYTDPPWGQGSMKYWTTMRKKMTGAEAEPMKYVDLLARVGYLAKVSDAKRVFVEGAVKDESLIQEALSRHGFTTQATRMEYDSGKGTLVTGTRHEPFNAARLATTFEFLERLVCK